jgi:hypothetical protein
LIPQLDNYLNGMQTAVLFLVFNRPDTTCQVFEAIRRARPVRLYIAADGPRDRLGEKELCEEVRHIATAVDWPCEVSTLFQEVNLGCKHAVSDGITWFFQHEEAGIILEDDCLPHESWFPFAQELLDRYRDDERIMNISAQHFHRDAHTPLHSYFFSRCNSCWGWASWRRAWAHYDRDMKLWPALRHTDWLLHIGDGSELFRRFWTRTFDMCHAGKIDTWDYQWKFSCWAQSGLAILPANNLVTNIGFGANATHTKSRDGINDGLPLEKMEYPLIHPNYMVRDVVTDRWTDHHVYGIGLKDEIMTTLRQLPGVKSLVKTLRVLNLRK